MVQKGSLTNWLNAHAQPISRRGYTRELYTAAIADGLETTPTSIDVAFYAWRRRQLAKPKRRTSGRGVRHRAHRKTGLIKRLREHKGAVIVILVPGKAELA